MHATLNGTEIFFDCDGSGLGISNGSLFSKPTIIAIHGGLGFDHAYLKPGFAKLTDIAQILFIDLRGQGRSGRPALETCTFEQMADDVVSLCKHLGIEKPVVFGHSAGGFVALHLSLRHPGFAGGLILCGSTPTLAPLEDDPENPSPSLASRASLEDLAIATRVFSGEITAETISAFFDKVGPYYAAPSNISIAAEILSLSSREIQMMHHFMTALAPTYDVRSQLPSIETSTLILVGSYDWVCPPRASRALAKSMPNSTLVEFEESGHLLFSEEPGKFHTVVSKFLQESTRPRS